jgi:hypothetical protein
MKYIAKGFVNLGSKFCRTGGKKENLVYTALIWKYGYRTFQPSRKLQKIMGYVRLKDMLNILAYLRIRI